MKRIKNFSFYLKKFTTSTSTTSTTINNNNTSNNNNNFFEKYKKYLIISSPFLLFLSFNLNIIYFNNFREFIEKNISLKYVEFLRNYVDFIDEDKIERERIIQINQQISKNVNVKLTFRDGNVIQYEKVEGNKSLYEFLTSIQNDSGIESIDFEDEVLESNNSDTFNISTKNEPIQVSLNSISPSFWETDFTSKNLNQKENSINPYLVQIDKEYILRRYNNILASFLSDVTKSKVIVQNEKNSTSTTFEEKTIQVYDPKQAAKESIQRLEKLIEQFEIEMRHGTREIDQIQLDINRTKNEITQLKRKYLNFFYYF